MKKYIDWNGLLKGTIDVNVDDFVNFIFIRCAQNRKKDWRKEDVNKEFEDICCTTAAFIKYAGLRTDSKFITEFTNILNNSLEKK